MMMTDVMNNVGLYVLCAILAGGILDGCVCWLGEYLDDIH